jgi:hypothetical protein
MDFGAAMFFTGVPEDPDRLRRHRDLGIARVVVSLNSAPANEILPVLDRWAELIGKFDEFGVPVSSLRSTVQNLSH